MPPRFSITRLSALERNSHQSTSGTSGAPSPPAAVSRDRKSDTTQIPVRSARTAADPICSVSAWPSDEARGTWRTVWP